MVLVELVVQLKVTCQTSSQVASRKTKYTVVTSVRCVKTYDLSPLPAVSPGHLFTRGARFTDGRGRRLATSATGATDVALLRHVEGALRQRRLPEVLRRTRAAEGASAWKRCGAATPETGVIWYGKPET